MLFRPTVVASTSSEAAPGHCRFKPNMDIYDLPSYRIVLYAAQWRASRWRSHVARRPRIRTDTRGVGCGCGTWCMAWGGGFALTHSPQLLMAQSDGRPAAVGDPSGAADQASRPRRGFAAASPVWRRRLAPGRRSPTEAKPKARASEAPPLDPKTVGFAEDCARVRLGSLEHLAAALVALVGPGSIGGPCVENDCPGAGVCLRSVG